MLLLIFIIINYLFNAIINFFIILFYIIIIN